MERVDQVTDGLLASDEGEDGEHQRRDVAAGVGQKTQQLFDDVGVDEVRRVDEGQDEEKPEAALAADLGIDAQLVQDGPTGQRLETN